MRFEQLDRHKLAFKPLKAREDRVFIERDHVSPSTKPRPLPGTGAAVVEETVARIRRARDEDRPRIVAFGAHAIKNGLGPVFIKLIEDGWVTHLATNGAGIIHDWEFAYQGHSSEHVRDNVAKGEFGLWEETGHYLNLAILVGAYGGLGYGESVGALVESEGLRIPSEDELRESIRTDLDADADRAAAAIDLLKAVRAFNLDTGQVDVAHPFKEYGLQAAAYRHGVPFTGHPMIGHDIIYCHPMNSCAAIGRAAERDFLAYAQSVSQLDGGVYLSIGSAVMSPMIFEKSLSMAQNLAIQRGQSIDSHFIVVVDLAESGWDWREGEPPASDPAYYLRYNKSFARMGGDMRYVSADNRDFLLALSQELES